MRLARIYYTAAGQALTVVKSCKPMRIMHDAAHALPQYNKVQTLNGVRPHVTCIQPCGMQFVNIRKRSSCETLHLSEIA
jgi:hypothetical protein